MPDIDHAEAALHHEGEELLPWYATGQLEAEDRRLLEEHLSSCAHCRRQLAFERRMVDEFAGLTPEVDSGWARLKARLETPPGRPPESVWEKASEGIAAAWRTFSRPAVAGLAFAQIAFVVIAGAVLLSLSRPSYHALSSAPPPRSANVIAMFSADTTEAQMLALLRANGASLVGGPTPTDVWLLSVPAETRATALARLHADHHVIMAQPIDRPSS